MLDRKEIIQEIEKVKDNFIGVKDELNTLKNRVRAYKGWTEKYRQKKKKLEQEVIILKNANKLISRENQKLYSKQQELLDAVAEGILAVKDRDRELKKLNEVIAKIEKLNEKIAKIEKHEIFCDRVNRTTDKDKCHLIREFEKLFFEEEETIPIINQDLKINPQDKPWMFTDQASIGRSLLDGN
jgi:chromosome segregation ATPase